MADILDFEDVFTADENDYELNDNGGYNNNQYVEIIELDENGEPIDVVEASLEGLPGLENDFDLYEISGILDVFNPIKHVKTLGKVIQGKKLKGTEILLNPTGALLTSGKVPKILNPLAQAKTAVKAIKGGKLSTSEKLISPTAALIGGIKGAVSGKAKAKVSAKTPKVSASVSVKTAAKKSVTPKKVTATSVIGSKVTQLVKAKKGSEGAKARPASKIVAIPKVASSAATLGCPCKPEYAKVEKLLGTSAKLLTKADLQRQATYEHKSLVSRDAFKQAVLAKLKSISGQLGPNHLSKERLVRAACGIR